MKPVRWQAGLQACRALAGHHRKNRKNRHAHRHGAMAPRGYRTPTAILSLSELRRSSTHTRSREKRERDSRERSLEYNPLSFEDDMAESR